MTYFKQAPHDPSKAARDGVTNYVPQRKQVNTEFGCDECPRTATWAVVADGRELHACADHRKELAIMSTNYQEKRL